MLRPVGAHSAIPPFRSLHIATDSEAVANDAISEFCGCEAAASRAALRPNCRSPEEIAPPPNVNHPLLSDAQNANDP